MQRLQRHYGLMTDAMECLMPANVALAQQGLAT
jgi:hypothetical protein